MLFRLEEVGNENPRPNDMLMNIMNEDLDFYTPPKSFADPGTGGYTGTHDRNTLYNDFKGTQLIRFFFKEYSDHLQYMIQDLKECCESDHMLFGYEFNERDGEIIYEDEWQVAIKFKHDQTHAYRNLISEVAAWL